MIRSIILAAGCCLLGVNLYGQLPMESMVPDSLARLLKSTPADTAEIFNIVDELPEFPGGEEAMYQYLSFETRYPKKALKAGVEGQTFVLFVVNETGLLSNIAIRKSSGNDDLDKESIRVVTGMPPWKPGKIKNKPVKVYFQVPILYKIADGEKPEQKKKP